MAGLDQTPAGLRTQIGIFGRTNSGKSSVLNMITGADTAIVSEVAGTTTDPVKKSMELGRLGPCLFIDTPGTFDPSSLSAKREDRMLRVMNGCDIALIIVNDAGDAAHERDRYEWFRSHKVRVMFVYNDIGGGDPEKEKITEELENFDGSVRLVAVNAAALAGKEELTEAIIELGDAGGSRSLLAGCVGEGDTVLLVMPQDNLAPKGRLILPQVMTIRELLDENTVSICVTADGIDNALAALGSPPKLIITDSQVFSAAYEKKPAKSRITSFSILMANLKGDIRAYVEGAKAIGSLSDGARVLIAESCTHAPADEDIGRVRIPALIRKKLGIDINVDICAGADFPADVRGYDLIIQCGGCMAGRRLIMSRIEQAAASDVPITNYGIAIAYLTGILDKVYIPGI